MELASTFAVVLLEGMVVGSPCLDPGRLAVHIRRTAFASSAEQVVRREAAIEL